VSVSLSDDSSESPPWDRFKTFGFFALYYLGNPFLSSFCLRLCPKFSVTAC
jgi:hypothetical protein